MTEKPLVRRAQIAQPIFSLSGSGKAMLWAFAVTSKLNLTFTTYLRQIFLLLQTELDLLWT
jgi:hypothetical protein